MFFFLNDNEKICLRVGKIIKHHLLILALRYQGISCHISGRKFCAYRERQERGDILQLTLEVKNIMRHINAIHQLRLPSSRYRELQTQSIHLQEAIARRSDRSQPNMNLKQRFQCRWVRRPGATMYLTQWKMFCDAFPKNGKNLLRKHLIISPVIQLRNTSRQNIKNSSK